VTTLLLFAPFGVGYALGYDEAMGLDRDVAEDLMERKLDVLEKMSTHAKR